MAYRTTIVQFIMAAVWIPLGVALVVLVAVAGDLLAAAVQVVFTGLWATGMSLYLRRVRSAPPAGTVLATPEATRRRAARGALLSGLVLAVIAVVCLLLESDGTSVPAFVVLGQGLTMLWLALDDRRWEREHPGALRVTGLSMFRARSERVQRAEWQLAWGDRAPS